MKKILFFTLIFTPILAGAANTDPFSNSIWYRDNNTLTTVAHTLDPGNYDHSLSYTLPTGESVSTDECSLKSATTLNCITGDQLVYSASTYSVTLSGQNHTTIIFYEKGHQPAGSPLHGTWHSTQKECDVSQIIVPFAESNDTTFYGIEEDYDGGGFSKDLTYYLLKDPYSGQIFFGGDPDPNHALVEDYGLYDANSNPITDMSKLNTLVTLSNTRFGGVCTFVKN